MAKLPYTRVVNVTLTRNDAFPTREGFGVPLILSDIVSDVTAGAVDATTLVKTYGTMAEVAEDWGVNTGAYAVAQDIFQQEVTPLQIKIGFCDPTDAASITSGLNAIELFDDGWYWLLPVAAGASWHDDSALTTAMVDWVETRSKMLGLLSTDANTESIANTTSIAYVHQQANLSRTFVAYHTDTTGKTSLHGAIAAYGATRNLDDEESAYTIKFKNFNGIADIDKGSAAVQAITGFVPNIGMDNTQGRFANTYVEIGGRDFVTEGTMCDGGFIDEMHFQDWLIARTKEEILALFLNTPRVPYSDKGFDMVAQAVQRVLNRALTNGTIRPYEDGDGNIVNWAISVPRVATIAASQRRQRIMPAIAVTFRYQAAVHFTTVNYTMTF